MEMRNRVHSVSRAKVNTLIKFKKISIVKTTAFPATATRDWNDRWNARMYHPPMDGVYLTTSRYNEKSPKIRSPEGLWFLRYGVPPFIRDSLKIWNGWWGVPISWRGWPIHTTGVGFAWVSGRQELSVSRYTLALRRRMYCWNKPSSCSAFPFPPSVLVPSIDTPLSLRDAWVPFQKNSRRYPCSISNHRSMDHWFR